MRCSHINIIFLE